MSLIFALASACPSFAAEKRTQQRNSKTTKTKAKVSQPLKPSKRSKTRPTKVRTKKKNLDELRGQIELLRQDMSVNEDKKADALHELKNIEQTISTTQRDTYQLSLQRDTMRQTLKALDQQSGSLERHLSEQQRQMEKFIYRHYVQGGNPDSLRLFLDGKNPSQMARDLVYLTAITKARSQLQLEIEKALQHQQVLANDTRARATALKNIEMQQTQQHQKLLSQREQRKKLLEEVSTKILLQRQAIGNLQRDEKELTQVIEQLAKAATQQAQAQARQREIKKPGEEISGVVQTPEKHNANKISEQEPRSEGSVRAPPENPPEAPRTAPPDANFARLKGTLRLPTHGSLNNRFGGSRQEGGRWKGLFIRTNAGNEVKAVAAGRVVFADWMRGFGNLLIIDHGANYLSVYGNNEALLKQTNDLVNLGEAIATVGNSGGNLESGLYFELRHQGQAFDPLKWVKLK